ncbi:MAG: SusD/RagB family nutrient-binding outer membrane lipoprotein [Saprospiraceae bacterium]
MKIKIVVLVMVLFVVSCKDFLDINDDPNNPTKAELSTILPYTQANMFGALGFGTAGITDILGVYTHQIVQRGNQDDYKVQANEFSLTQCWEKLYAVGLPDLNQIIKQAGEEHKPVYSGIARALKAHMFSVMVDLWGNIAYSEAGDPSKFPFPHYDSGEVIYADVLTQLDAAIADLQAGGPRPGADDLIYGGDPAKWIKYANSVKLSIYNKLRLTSLYNAAAVTALLSQPLISSVSEDFQLRYTTSISPENRNPGFVREYAQNNPQYYISPYFYLLMKGEQACQNSLMVGIHDPRIPYYFYNQLAPGEAAQNPESYRDGEFLSIWFGSYNRDPNEGFDQATSQTIVGLYPVGGAYDNGSAVKASGDLGLKGSGAQRLVTAACVDYVRAELALTEGTSDDARAMLASAISKSFAEVNAAASLAGVNAISAADITAYSDAVLALFDAGDADKKLEVIMTQKWIQEFGSGSEAYCDIRRTGYPQVCDPAQDPNEFSIQTNPYPVSLPYSGNDLTNNGNAPMQRNQYLDKIFWDKN